MITLEDSLRYRAFVVGAASPVVINPKLRQLGFHEVKMIWLACFARGKGSLANAMHDTRQEFLESP
jgi:hypothetical protein